MSSVSYAPNTAQAPKTIRINKNAWRVYERLLWHANGKSTCWPSAKHLEEKLLLGESTITRAVRRLVAAGWIATKRGSRGRGKGRTGTVYTILQPVRSRPIQAVRSRKSDGLYSAKVTGCNAKSDGLYRPYPISEITTERSASESARASEPETCPHCGQTKPPAKAKTPPPEGLEAIAATLDRHRIGYFDQDLHWLHRQSADKPDLILLFIERAARQRPYRIQSCALLRTIVAEGFPRFRLAVEHQETPKMPAMMEVSREVYAAIHGFDLAEVCEVFRSPEDTCPVDTSQYSQWLQNQRTGT